MRFASFHTTSAMLLLASMSSTTVTAAPTEEVISAGTHIQRMDATSDCLSPSARALSGSSRVTLDSVAHELQATMFRDFHQFAPVAVALGNSDIESKILGTDYTQVLVGLRELQTLFKDSVPETAKSAGDSDACSAPTAQNLRVISTNLDNLLKQFA